MSSNNSFDSLSKTRNTRLLVVATALLILSFAVSLTPTAITHVEAQKAARRTVSGSRAPKSGKVNLGTRRSREAQVVSVAKTSSDGTITPGKIITDGPIQIRTEVVMAAQKTLGPKTMRPERPELQGPDRRNLPEGPGAIPGNQWPLPAANAPVSLGAPQTLGTQFNGATGPNETGAFPPDTEGAVGPTQFFVFLNGRMRTFNKNTGVADGILNVDPDVFFASVMTPPLAGEVVFTSDPNVRFDRLSNRWFVNIIDVILNPTNGELTRANRVLIAVSDAASNGSIAGATVWTFYQFQGDANLFSDYQSFGIDASAMYIGADMFTLPGSFDSTRGFVIPKAPALAGSPLTVWSFAGLVATPTGAGPFAPRGVDNYDPNNTGLTATGYFIGVDNATFNTLMLRRVTNPGSLGPAPTISANISVTTPLTTRFPVPVPHLGNTGGNAGRLDSLDDRLYAAHLRNDRLWTAQNIGVNNTGVAGVSNNRNASRWYELQDVATAPTVRQSGTLFDDTLPNNTTQRSYWIPSIMVSGQGHAALGCSIAGASERANAFTTGRLSADALGTLRDGPGGAALSGYTASSTDYNPPGDPGGVGGRRWGDYSLTVLDPLDDMTMWTIQEYCNGTNTYGVQAVKLIAPPPPPTNTASPAAFQLNNPSTNVVVTGNAPAGQGFYDPGPDPPPPHTPFNHISASGPGIIVNSTTYNSPTQVTLNVSTVGSAPGVKTITITNPDGQTTTVNVTVGPTAAPATISGSVNTGDGSPVGGVTMRLSGPVNRVTITDASGIYHFDGVDTENFYTVTPSLVNYRFSPTERSFSLLGNKTDAVFSAAADAIIRANAIDNNEYFVRQQYLDFLGREPDSGGFEYWRTQINECGTDVACVRARRINVSAAFFAEREFQQTGSFIYRMYKGVLGRQLTFTEFSADRVQVVEGPNLEATKIAFSNVFVARQEFLQKYQNSTTASSFVDALLESVSISSGATLTGIRTDLIAKYNTGTSLNESRALVVRDVSDNSILASALYNNAFVLMEYFGYLRRDPDQGGYDFWLNILNNRDPGNYRGMVCAFITSAEYQRRFSTVVTRTNADCGQ